MTVQFSVVAAAINSCNLRSDVYSLECVFSTDPIKLRILWAAVPRDAAIFSTSASILKSWCGAVQFFASYERQLDSSSHPKSRKRIGDVRTGGRSEERRV